MDIFAMIFAVLMIAAAVAATVVIGILAGGIWATALCAILFYALYRAATHQTGPDGPMERSRLNAFQGSLSED